MFKPISFVVKILLSGFLLVPQVGSGNLPARRSSGEREKVMAIINLESKENLAFGLDIWFLSY